MVKLSRFLKTEKYLSWRVGTGDKPEYLEDNMIQIVKKEQRDDILWCFTIVRCPVPHHDVMFADNCHTWQSSNTNITLRTQRELNSTQLKSSLFSWDFTEGGYLLLLFKYIFPRCCFLFSFIPTNKTAQLQTVYFCYQETTTIITLTQWCEWCDLEW